MGLSKLDNLYRQVILDHSSHPHHRGSLTDSTSKIELNNPTCGDVIELQVDVKDG
ncbi:nitrogen fixation protein NifU, partial [Enterococcus faecium MRSN 4777]